MIACEVWLTIFKTRFTKYILQHKTVVNDKIHRLIGTALGIKPSRQWKDKFFVQDDVFGLIVDDVVNLSSKQSVSNSTISCFYHKPSLKILLRQFHRKKYYFPNLNSLQWKSNFQDQM